MITKNDLNNAAMQIILHAGDCRNFINEALTMLEDGKDSAAIDEKYELAKKEITKAHQIQTKMIQDTIESDDFNTTLLFSHAQDTLMTINSEFILAKHMIAMFRKLENGGN